MSRLCLSLTGKTLAKDLEILEKYRRHIDLAELRVDCLEPDERFYIRRFPEQAGLPVILTVRRVVDGGYFSGGEGSRLILFSTGLAFAEVDKRKNFAYVDLEDDLRIPSLEEAARVFGTRIIRSTYHLEGMIDDIPGAVTRLLRAGDEIPKLVMQPETLGDTAALYESARRLTARDKILVAQGPLGIHARLLPEKTGSYLSYSGIPDEAAGLLDPREMDEFYRFRRISRDTRLFAVLGAPCSQQFRASLNFFNPLFAKENIDALFIPVPADGCPSFFRFAEAAGLEGASITSPFKEAIIPFLNGTSQAVDRTGACTAVVRGPQGWTGYNTEAQGFSESLLEFLDRKNLNKRRVTLVGAGGAARAAAAELARLKADALVLNRGLSRGRGLARTHGFAYGGLDAHGLSLAERFNHIIIHAVPPEETPLQDYTFTGREVAMDLNFTETPFLQQAAGAGCLTLNGCDMFIRQASSQYFLFMGKELDPEILAKAEI
jgi:3-dehydroquinate dehydratase/shikimate dehydrogenase